MTGLTPGFYVTRYARYEVDREGRVWLVDGQELPDWEDRREVSELPGDAVMTNAEMRAGAGGGSTPPGKGPDFEQTHEGNESAD